MITALLTFLGSNPPIEELMGCGFFFAIIIFQAVSLYFTLVDYYIWDEPFYWTVGIIGFITALLLRYIMWPLIVYIFDKLCDLYDRHSPCDKI
jgi:hypothetical protein